MRSMHSARLGALALSAFAASAAALADEGMWTFDNFPAAEVAKKYDVKITPQWLDRVRTATVRLSNCTASFVSPDGLILTNHHCAEQCLSELSSKEKSYVQDGFVAKTRAEEKRCGTQVADVLVGMEDITAKVEAATRGKDDTAANDARKQTLTALEQACEQESRKGGGGPLKCETVTLYQGGQYFLYKYRRYDDVRMVFAPESAIAAFGGDPDNFQFPRWCLDMAFMRAYDGGKPVRTQNHLKIDFAGPQAGDPVFVSGHPGSTSRQLTVAELQFLQETALPSSLLRASELRGRYLQFAKTGEQAERIVQAPLNNLENSIKVQRKLLDALLDDELVAMKEKDQSQLQARAKSQGASGDPWGEIEKALQVQRSIWYPYIFLDNSGGGGGNALGFNSALYRYARALVRGTSEREKPNEDRLREYTDAALPRLEQTLEAPTPVYPELEQLTLSYSLERMREWLGPDHPVVRKLLSKDSPDTLAERLVEGSKLADPDVRMKLWKGGAAAVAASNDPMIELARSMEPEARALRKRYEDEIEAPSDAASERIARARFEALGTSVYPDATFTLRLNYGTVQGWTENGQDVVPFTRLERLFERATGQHPFRIPESWLKVKDKLDMSTPFNFTSNNDIVGGNSGSPVIGAAGNIVGLAFDGNIHSISGAYWFDTEKNRMIAVHPAIMREALTKVYDAPALRKELGLR